MEKINNRFYLCLGYVLSISFSFIPSFRIVNLILKIFKNDIGKGTTFHNGVRFLIPFNIKIGNNTTIGNNVKIYTLTHDIEDNHFKSIGKSVLIGSNVVIFPHVLIMPGVKIGDGAVVYPGSIVTKDIESYSIVAGIPAKKVGKRKLRDFKYKLSYKTYFGI